LTLFLLCLETALPKNAPTKIPNASPGIPYLSHDPMVVTQSSTAGVSIMSPNLTDVFSVGTRVGCSSDSKQANDEHLDMNDGI